jgi:hypothetical protein
MQTIIQVICSKGFMQRADQADPFSQCAGRGWFFFARGNGPSVTGLSMRFTDAFYDAF